MNNPANESSTKKGSLEEHKQYDVRVLPPRHSLFPPYQITSSQLIITQAPNLQPSLQSSSRQCVRENERLLHIAREHGGVLKGGEVQQPNPFVGSSPMLEFWLKEKARDGPFHGVDAVVGKKP